MWWTRYRNVENETIWISSRFSQMKEKLLKIAENSQICLGFRLEQLFLKLWKQKGFIVKLKTIPWLSQFATGNWSLINIFFMIWWMIQESEKNCTLFPKLFWQSRKTFKIRDWRVTICKIFEITSTIYSNNERWEQFLVTECFFNLLLKVFQI